MAQIPAVSGFSERIYRIWIIPVSIRLHASTNLSYNCYRAGQNNTVIIPLLLIVWIYLFYHAKKQGIKTPWAFGWIILCAILGLSYISIKSIAGLRISPLIFLIVGWLINASAEEKKVLFLPSGWGKSLILGLGLGLLFSLIMMKIDPPNNLPPALSPGVIIFSAMQNALGGEFLFRGFLLNYLLAQRIKPGFANLIQIICSMSVYVLGLSTLSAWFYFAFSAIYALVTGVIVLKYRNLSGPILMNLAVNLSSVINIL